MRLSKREKGLLLVLILSVVLFGYYRFIIVPQNLALADLEVQLHTVEQEHMALQRTVASEDQLKQQLKEIDQDLFSIAGGFYGELEQEDIILIINDFLVKDVFDISAVNFSLPQAEVLQSATVDSADTEEEEMNGSSRKEPLTFLKTSSQFSYESNYAGLVNLLAHLRQYQGKALVSSMSIAGNDNGQLTGSITLDFYNVPQIAHYYPGRPKAITYTLTDHVQGSGLSNPFDRNGDNILPAATPSQAARGEEHNRQPASSSEPATTTPDVGNARNANEQIRGRSIEKENQWVLAVEEGDTIYRITVAFYGDFIHAHHIIDANYIEDPDFIQIGQVLQIPKIQ